MPLPEGDAPPVLLHNPGCSKSRAALALLEERGAAFQQRLYLEAPLSREELGALQERLGRPPGEWVRKGEAAYAEAGLTAESGDAAILDAMAQHPVLVERPILVTGARAVVGRPPENVLGLLRSAAAMELLFVQTGGTIDKDYPKTVGGYAFEITDPAAARVMSSVLPESALRWRVVSVCRKDSLDIDAADRSALARAIAADPAEKVVVTHGTSTMLDTAAFLAAAEGLSGKTVVLTGAFKPERMLDSDAPFNVGLAAGAAQTLPRGVWVAMQGRVYRWDAVRQDPRSGAYLPARL